MRTKVIQDGELLIPVDLYKQSLATCCERGLLWTSERADVRSNGCPCTFNQTSGTVLGLVIHSNGSLGHANSVVADSGS